MNTERKAEKTTETLDKDGNAVPEKRGDGKHDWENTYWPPPWSDFGGMELVSRFEAEKTIDALEAKLAEAIKAIERLQALKWDEFNGVAKEAEK